MRLFQRQMVEDSAVTAFAIAYGPAVFLALEAEVIAGEPGIVWIRKIVFHGPARDRVGGRSGTVFDSPSGPRITNSIRGIMARTN